MLIHIQLRMRSICCICDTKCTDGTPFHCKGREFYWLYCIGEATKVMKEKEIGECVVLAMFRHLLCSTHNFRCIQSCDTLHLQKSACLCNDIHLIVYRITFFWFQSEQTIEITGGEVVIYYRFDSTNNQMVKVLAAKGLCFSTNVKTLFLRL